MKNVVKRFLEYVAIDTMSDPKSEKCPSTEKQKKLGSKLVKELLDLGLTDASMDENGYIMATLESNTDKKVPVIGLIAHMDTSPDYSAENVKPQIFENYDGKDVILNKQENIIMSVKEFPALEKYKGQTLITTDGTTLLGADNKAGIAEIIEAVSYFVSNPEVKHGKIKIGFTPDEEIGRGANLFDVKKFGADFGYTVDGGEIGGVEYENFNAANAVVKINGTNIHPGSAKNKMLNSILIGMELTQMLPNVERPEHTELYEGFTHLNDFNGSVENTEMIFIVRDHNMEKFEKKKRTMIFAVEFLNHKYGEGVVELELVDSYFNMAEKVIPEMHIIDTAVEAMKALNIEPIINPVRGGTDGARLSYMGLVTPNLFTGGANFHGKYEFIIAESMQSSVNVIIKIIELYTKK